MTKTDLLSLGCQAYDGLCPTGKASESAAASAVLPLERDTGAATAKFFLQMLAAGLSLPSISSESLTKSKCAESEVRTSDLYSFSGLLT